MTQTLQPGEYILPEGHTFKVTGRTIKVYPSLKRKLGEGDFRCKDCRHFAKGYTSGSSHFLTTVCRKKPKHVEKPRNGQQYIWYAASRLGKPCNLFEKTIKTT